MSRTNVQVLRGGITLPRVAIEPQEDAALAELVKAGRPHAQEPLSPRDRRTEAVVGGAFLAAALATALLVEAERGWPVGEAIALVVLFAAAARVQIDVGAGYSAPTQLVLVPMLLLLPTPWVPLLVSVGWFAGRLPDVLRGRSHPERLAFSLADGWGALFPALVLVAAGAQTPEWIDWPWYLLALLAQFAGDFAVGALREWMGRGVAPSLQLRAVTLVYVIDALLSPLGLLAAFASEQQSFAFLLVVPPAGMLVVYARERTSRLANAIALGERARESAELNARLLASERAAARSREELIAGASHEILTPLAVLTGLVGRLSSDVALDPARRDQVHAAMRRELTQLRHLVRQFLDYTRLKADRSLAVTPRPTDVRPLLEEVAEAFSPHGDVRVDVDDSLREAHADGDRVHQMLMSLVSNAVKFSPPGTPVTISARGANGMVEVSVADRGQGIPREVLPGLFDELRRGPAAEGPGGAGIGLYICRVLAEAQHGEVTVESEEGAGSRFTIRLPAAASQ